jgi:hypothetical protein
MRHLGLEVLAWIFVDEVENARQADVGQGQTLTHQPGLKGKHASFQGISVADPDPGSGAFFNPGSEIGFFRIPDPKSIFLIVITNFWVKSRSGTIIPSVLAITYFFTYSKINYLKFYDI